MRRLFENARKTIVAALRRFAEWLAGSDTQDAGHVRPVVAEPELELGTADSPQYRVKKSLSSGAELAFYRKLCDEVGQDYQIFAKVRLGDVMHLANEPANRKYHNNQIQCKHFDFLLCHKETHQPLMAVELDDISHSRFRSQQSDEFKERVCAQAGLPLLRLNIQQSYGKGSIAELVRKSVNN